MGKADFFGVDIGLVEAIGVEEADIADVAGPEEAGEANGAAGKVGGGVDTTVGRGDDGDGELLEPFSDVDNGEALGAGEDDLFTADDGEGEFASANEGDAICFEAVIEFDFEPFSGVVAISDSDVEGGVLGVGDIAHGEADGTESGIGTGIGISGGGGWFGGGAGGEDEDDEE